MSPLRAAPSECTVLLLVAECPTAGPSLQKHMHLLQRAVPEQPRPGAGSAPGRHSVLSDVAAPCTCTFPDSVSGFAGLYKPWCGDKGLERGHEAWCFHSWFQEPLGGPGLHVAPLSELSLILEQEAETEALPCQSVCQTP